MYRDPNQPYVPEAYPRMLYASRDNSITVQSAEDEARARARGFTDFHDIDDAQDHLEQRETSWLVDRAVTLIRANLARLPKDELIEGLRDLEAKEAKRLAEAAAHAPQDAFDASDDDALRVFITERDGKPPHHRAGRDRLLAMARAEPIPA